MEDEELSPELKSLGLHNVAICIRLGDMEYEDQKNGKKEIK